MGYNPSPSFPFYILLNKEYYKNKLYIKYTNKVSILGILPEDVLKYLDKSDLDLKIKFKIIYFLTMIKMKVENGSSSRSCAGKGWVNLKASVLDEIFGTRDWTIVRKICLKEGFVETDDEFLVGQHTKSYRISPKIKRFKSIRYFGKGKAFNSLLNKLRKVESKPIVFESEFEKKVSAHFLKILNEIKLAENYADFIDSTWASKIESYIFACERVLNVDHKIKINRENGRWTHSVSNFPKVLRDKLIYNGEPFIDLDYSNMQPWMAVSLYPFDCPEKEKYIKIVKEGIFYEFFAKRVGKDISQDEKRKQFKQRILRECFFGDMDYVKYYKIWDVFIHEFPILTKEIIKFRKTGKREFAMFLQRKESRITIDGALDELIDVGIPCLSIHDSFMCREKDAEMVKKTMIRHFMKYIPHEPTIKISIDNIKKMDNNQLK